MENTPKYYHFSIKGMHMEDKNKDITISTGTKFRAKDAMVRFYWSGDKPKMSVETTRSKPVEFDMTGVLEFFDGARQ